MAWDGWWGGLQRHSAGLGVERLAALRPWRGRWTGPSLALVWGSSLALTLAMFLRLSATIYTHKLDVGRYFYKEIEMTLHLGLAYGLGFSFGCLVPRGGQVQVGVRNMFEGVACIRFCAFSTLSWKVQPSKSIVKLAWFILGTVFCFIDLIFYMQ